MYGLLFLPLGTPKVATTQSSTHELPGAGSRLPRFGRPGRAYRFPTDAILRLALRECETLRLSCRKQESYQIERPKYPGTRDSISATKGPQGPIGPITTGPQCPRFKQVWAATRPDWHPWAAETHYLRSDSQCSGATGAMQRSGAMQRRCHAASVPSAWQHRRCHAAERLAMPNTENIPVLRRSKPRAPSGNLHSRDLH